MVKPLRILMIEGNPADAELMLQELRQAGYAPELTRVETEADFLDRLGDPIDLILADFPGLRAFEVMRERRLKVPFIIVSEQIDQEIVAVAMEHGVADFLTKDRLPRLGAIVGRALEQAHWREEKRKVEEKVRDQARLLDLAQDAILVRNLDRKIVYWNKGAERLYGWTAEEVLGRSLVCTLAIKEPFEAAMEILLAQGFWHGELIQPSKSGKEIEVDCRWTLVLDEAGNPKSVLVINTGITERKALERQFLRAKRLESIGTLAGGVAHDLNNVLAPILMAAPLLHEELPPDMRNRLVSTIEESSQRAADIVEQMLTFARGAQGERLPLQPAQLVSDILKVVTGTFPKSIEVVEQVSEDLRMITGDSTQMHQVMLSLCVNARDAMPNGGTLTLSAENFDMDAQYASMTLAGKPGPYVLISVTDTGTGIPPQVIDKIFDPFFTTKGEGRGSGLGLSTALGILKSHGGFVNVSSEAGSGTTFKLFLPVSSEPASDAAVARGRDSSIFGQGELVLVVDDEAGIRAVTETMLKKNGYQVLLAADGTEAIVLYAKRRNEIALVVTDIMMPYLDGGALAHALRKIDPRVRIIASTGQPDDIQMMALYPSTVQAFLSKPYGRNELLSTIHRVLSMPMVSTEMELDA